jgi:cytochrome c oxidase subunit 2
LKNGRTLSHWVEFVWTVSPALLLWAIGIPSLKLLYLMDEILDPRLSVKVKGSQWFWSYEYGGSNLGFDSFISTVADSAEKVELFRQYAVDNFLVLPIHSPVRLLVTSNDVIHSFALPSLAIKVDAIPGRLNMAGLIIHSTGIYYGQCSELCGVLHGFMPIAIQAVTLPAFLSTIYWLPYPLCHL